MDARQVEVGRCLSCHQGRHPLTGPGPGPRSIRRAPLLIMNPFHNHFSGLVLAQSPSLIIGTPPSLLLLWSFQLSQTPPPLLPYQFNNRINNNNTKHNLHPTRESPAHRHLASAPRIIGTMPTHTWTTPSLEPSNPYGNSSSTLISPKAF